jgi:hypothetical protein
MQGDELLDKIRELGGIGGLWWLPKTPEQQIRGKLFFVNENLELEVERGFQDIKQWALPVQEVLGSLRDGTACSLSELHSVSMESNTAETGRTVYLIRLALLGVQTEHPNQLKVRRLRLPVAIAADWAAIQCYDIAPRGRDLSVRCSSRKTVRLGMAKGVGLSISTGVNWEIGSLPSQAPVLRVSSGVDLSIKSGRSLEKVLSYLPTIASLLSLATLSPIRFNHLYCESDAARFASPVSPPLKRRHYRYRPIVVWYDGLPANFTTSGVSERNMFVTFSDLEHSKQTDVFSRVLARREEFDQLLPLMVPESGRFQSYSEQRFLNATQVLESLDRMAGNNEDLDPDVFSSTKKEILEKVRNPRQNWLEELLEYANEPCLRERLKRVVRQNASIFHTTYRKEKSFINDVINTRNYLVHHDSGKRGKAVLDGRLIDLTDKVEGLDRFLLLRYVGFSEQNLADLFHHTERRYIRALNALF